MRIALATLNCAGRLQTAAGIAEIVKATAPKDIFVLGVQEAAPVLQTLLGTTQAFFEPIYEGIAQALPDYKLVGEQWTGGIGVLVYARSSLAGAASCATASTSFGRLWTDLKGAAACRVLLNGSKYTFVCTHLPAHQGPEFVRMRNEAFRILASGLAFGDGNLYATNHLFVLGDLNYRAGGELLENQEFAEAHDELLTEYHAGNLLWNLHEAPIAFKPTFKYVLNSQQLSQKRRPAWTDRIFYSQASARVEAYNSLHQYTSTDHRPVFLVLEVDPVARVESYSVPSVFVCPNGVSVAASRAVGTGMFLATTRVGLFLVAMALIGLWVVW